MTNFVARFLSNNPIGEDLFEGKSQDRVAKYIANNVVNNDKCNIIGIDGGWGSGKSNLLEITKKKLNQQSNGKYHFFVYDAWGHQEDLQRRSFLEELTTFLTKPTNGSPIINDPEKWKNNLKALLSKAKETQTKTIPSLSIGVVCSVLAIIITPIFKAVSDPVKQEWLKIFITAIPLLSLIFLYVVYYYRFTNKALSIKLKLEEALQKLFHIYQKSQLSNTKFETISEDEPSVKKFRDWMHDIATDLKDQKLIIVFDNMDRLPDQKITELWSSIHTFFAEETYTGIKVLIPFDRQNIKSAFKHENNTEHDFTNDFINKTFDIVYRVSPPILSDWKAFFISKWKEALGSNSDEEQKVVQVFDHLSKCKTPRDIVAFINECVATTQICPEIPLHYIALFVLNKTVIMAEPEKEIISPSYLSSLDFLYSSDENLSKYIAATIYQIDPERALEVVFTNQLVTALNGNDSSRVRLISDSTVFSVILEKALMSVDNLKNAVISLNEIETEVSQKNWDDLYQKLFKSFNQFEDSKVSFAHNSESR